MNTYSGVIIAESLTDPTIINQLKIISGEVCGDPNNDRQHWHLYTVKVTENQVEMIAAQLKPAGFYAHFGTAECGLVAFPHKVFKLNPRQSDSWGDAIAYGLRLGIPDTQLDFSFDQYE